jgi:hypothetical protein
MAMGQKMKNNYWVQNLPEKHSWEPKQGIMKWQEISCGCV